MKHRLIAKIFAVISLAAVIASLSCTDAPQNNTANKINTAGNDVGGNSNTETGSSANDPDCSGDASVKQKKIKDGVKANIDKKDPLKYQYPNNFEYEPVMGANDDATLYIWGKILTSRQDLDELNKTYKGFIKKGCVTKVVFAPAPNVKATASGFDFELCESPHQVCSNGTCQQTCPKIDANTNTNTNTNINTNSAN